MARQDEFQAQSPVQLYYDWRSDENSFCYYDKEADSRVAAGIPFKFLVLKQMVSVTGVHPSTKVGIYSNQVKYTTKEELTVRYQDGTDLAKGYWKDIKDLVKQNGGHYTKIIYGMDVDGVIICIRIRGEALLSWGHIVGKNEKRQFDEWILNDDYESKVYDEKPYSVPSFKFGGSVSVEDFKKSDEAHDLLVAYFSGKQSAAPTKSTSSPHAMPTSGPPADLFVTQSQDDSDDLPF